MVAIIGEIASGKTFFINKLKEMGYKIFIADEYVNYLYQNNDELKKKFIEVFGEEVVQNNKISKEFLKQKINENFETIYLIENLVFPYIFSHLEHEKYDFAEIPVLVSKNTNFLTFFDKVINVVSSPQKIQIQREKRNVDNSFFKTLNSKNNDFFHENQLFTKIDVVNISDYNRENTELIKEFLIDNNILN